MGTSLLGALCALATLSARAADSDIPKSFQSPTADQDFIKREVMIPMRDSVKVYTVIVVPLLSRRLRWLILQLARETQGIL
jgi:hypothetical protein